jgi:hypothetical protein
MKPYIEVLPDQVIIETEAMTITVHVKAQRAESRGQSAEGRGQRAENMEQRAKSDPGCGLTYTRKAVVESAPPAPPKGGVKPYPTGEMLEELDQAIDEHLAGYKPKRKLNIKPRVCVVCGKTYKPTGTTQRACSKACKAEMKRKRQLSEMEESELDKTLAEIEERRKRTYEVSK